MGSISLEGKYRKKKVNGKNEDNKRDGDMEVCSTGKTLESASSYNQ